MGPGPLRAPLGPLRALARALLRALWALMAPPGPLKGLGPPGPKGPGPNGSKRNFVSPGYLPYKKDTDQRTHFLAQPHLFVLFCFGNHVGQKYVQHIFNYMLGLIYIYIYICIYIYDIVYWVPKLAVEGPKGPPWALLRSERPLPSI